MNTLLRPPLANVYTASFASTHLELHNNVFTLETDGNTQQATLPLALLADTEAAETTCFTLRDMLIDTRSAIVQARNTKRITPAESVALLQFFNTCSIKLICNGSDTGIEQLQQLRNFELLARQFEEAFRTIWETVCRTEIKYNGYN